MGFRQAQPDLQGATPRENTGKIRRCSVVNELAGNHNRSIPNKLRFTPYGLSKLI
jgi:hypothetical protein